MATTPPPHGSELFTREMPNRSEDLPDDRSEAHMSELSADLETFQRQESIFVVLNLLVLALLLVFHTLFASLLGNPSTTLLLLLGGVFLIRTVELVWLQARSTPLPPIGVATLTIASIGSNLVLAIALAMLTNRQDSPYWVLLAMPVIESAFRFSLFSTIGIVVFGAASNLFWVRHFAKFHPPVSDGEYFEAATISLIYLLVGSLVSLLVSQLRQKEQAIARNLEELNQTREQLVREEKLGAVGRFAGAIAHEIRNPVAMISSSLETATNSRTDPADREEMFQIAAREANRLEKLTTDFLQYARTNRPNRTECNLAELIGYVADLCRARATEKGLTIVQRVDARGTSHLDVAQIQQALMNLLINSLQAAPEGSQVILSATMHGGVVSVLVENGGAAISAADRDRIFEPFFTTKPRGTGLGLAITRNIARAHGGDVLLSHNEAGRVAFTLTLPVQEAHSMVTHG